MTLDLKEWIEILCKLKISPNQYAICMLVYDKDVASTLKYYHENAGKQFTYAEIDELVDKEYLLRLSKDPKNYQLDYFTITEKFKSDFLIDEDDAGDEFWNTYPSWIWMNNRKVSAKSCDKDELIENYNRKIKGKKKLHLKILETIKEYSLRNDGFAIMGIEKFVGSEQWTILKEEYDRDGTTGDLVQNI